MIIALFLFFVALPLAIQLLFEKWFWYLVVAPIALIVLLNL